MSNKPRNTKQHCHTKAEGIKLSPMEVRLQQVTDVLGQVLKFNHPADAVLSKWFREHRQLGGRDRGEVAEAVFEVLRHLRRYRQYAESGVGAANRRLAILGLVMSLGQEKVASALEAPEQDWLMRILKIEDETLNPAVRFSLPEWLFSELSKQENANDLMNALNTKAPLDIRVNPLKGEREEVLATLQKQEPTLTMKPTPLSPWGIRFEEKPSLNRWSLFEKGVIEVQDEGSQLLCMLVSPRRSDMVIDFCAGAGGKTLLLGAMMRSQGRLYAFDVSGARLAKAKPRIARSGLSNVTCVQLNNENDVHVKRLAGKAQRVLVDAPCSGMGTLRRNPDLKWRQTPEDLDELRDLQARILNSASRCVAPGGRLIYSTCSLLPQENEEQVKAFLASHPDFVLVPFEQVLGDRNPGLSSADGMLHLRPDVHGTDGFFAAVLERVS